MSAAKLVIVGGGIVGLTTAWYARRDGWHVTIIERNAPDHDGCSLGNAGLITPSHFVPLAAPGMASMALRSLFTPQSPVRLEPRFNFELLRFGWRFLRAANAAQVRRNAPVLRDFCMLSRSLYRDLDRELGGSFGLRQAGVMTLVRDARHLAEEAALAEQGRLLGLDAAVLTPADVQRMDPSAQYSVAGGVLFRDDGNLDPPRLYAELTRRLQRDGVEFLWQTEALGWDLDAQRVRAVRTTRGALVGDEFVLATGAWTPTLRQGLGVSLTIQAGKGYSFDLLTPPAMPTLPSILVESRIAVTPLADRLRFAGTMQFAGRNLARDKHRADAMTAAICEYFPQFRAEHFSEIRPWAGLRPVTPDGLPMLGRAPRATNLIVAAGHAMIGVTLAPATGLLVADLLASRKPALPLAPFAPARFG